MDFVGHSRYDLGARPFTSVGCEPTYGMDGALDCFALLSAETGCFWYKREESCTNGLFLAEYTANSISAIHALVCEMPWLWFAAAGQGIRLSTP